MKDKQKRIPFSSRENGRATFHFNFQPIHKNNQQTGMFVSIKYKLAHEITFQKTTKNGKSFEYIRYQSTVTVYLLLKKAII